MIEFRETLSVFTGYYEYENKITKKSMERGETISSEWHKWDGLGFVLIKVGSLLLTSTLLIMMDATKMKIKFKALDHSFSLAEPNDH